MEWGIEKEGMKLLGVGYGEGEGSCRRMTGHGRVRSHPGKDRGQTRGVGVNGGRKSLGGTGMTGGRS